MTIDFTQTRPLVLWEMHRAIGIWSVLLILMWAITGMYFAFPSFARSLITSVSPLTPNRVPASSAPMAGATAPSWREMIAIAQREHPGGHVARVVLPFGDRGAFLVMFADRSPTPAFAQLDSVYLDRLSGARLRTDVTPPHDRRHDRALDGARPRRQLRRSSDSHYLVRVRAHAGGVVRDGLRRVVEPNDREVGPQS